MGIVQVLLFIKYLANIFFELRYKFGFLYDAKLIFENFLTILYLILTI